MVGMVTPASSQSSHHHRRWTIPAATTLFSTYKTLVTALWLGFFLIVFYWQRDATGGLLFFGRGISSRQLPKLRPVAFNLMDFGAVGDGVTLNTVAFERAVMAISKLGKKVEASSTYHRGIGSRRHLISRAI